ncbi:hypothetical protein ACSBR1_002584 [Camellia fascicularis]
MWILKSSRKPFNQRELRWGSTKIKFITSLIQGGSDTTTTTLTWAVSLLLNHPTALKTAQQEIDMYVGHEKVRWVDESDTKKLVYLQAILKETLRLYPPGPLSIPRESIQDCHVSGYYVPKGTRLIVNIWKLHHDPCLSTDPNEFRPERFLTWQAKANLRGQQFEFLPFGAGRRSCPGNTLAYQTLHLILARLLQGFNLTILPGNGKVDMSEGLGLTLPKATPLEVLVIPRLPMLLYFVSHLLCLSDMDIEGNENMILSHHEFNL